jgi:hypothetical protein
MRRNKLRKAKIMLWRQGCTERHVLTRQDLLIAFCAATAGEGRLGSLA